QQSQYLSLLSHKLDISTPEVYTSEGVPVLANGVAIIKVGGATDDIATAAEQFLGKPVDALKGEAREVLEGHLRAILGGMTVEEVYRNRDKFAQEVQGVAARDLKKMGLQIVSFTIKDVQDNHGYLDALGKPRIAAVKRDAEIAEAEAVRDARIRKALAEEEGQKAELLRDTSIAEATKEKELKVAAFRKEQETAKADA
ncbi:flotillin family protein, partial [Salmonella enterica]|nr:flotillin family protein [Salmonella enterica]